MTYAPDITDYQQLREPITGNVDCTAYCGAILVDAHTQGKTKTTGRAVRVHSDEARPDPASPGLNLPQVRDSVLEITAGKVSLDTKVQSQALNRAQVQAMIVDGRWGTLQLIRGVLVTRGFGAGSDFRGGHAETVHVLPGEPDVPVLGDPLVPHYIRASWDAVFDAAEAFARPFTPGRVYAQFTRDLTPDYRVAIPMPRFVQYVLNAKGHIVKRRGHNISAPIHKPCTPPSWHVSDIAGVGSRSLVQFTTNAGTRMWVDARYAKEIYP
jgi:hypothetical protein